MTKITDDIEFIDLAVYLPRHKIVIFSDFHIGYEETMTRQGLMIPRFQFKDTIRRLTKIFSRMEKIQRIIINGDLKHEFGDISPQEWRDILKLLDYLSKKCEEIIVVQGNHDMKLAPITRKRSIRIVRKYDVADILVTHGDMIDEQSADDKIQTIIIGHEHPAITLRSKVRTEKFKCFLKGKWRGKTLIVQPSFNLLSEGSDVLEGTHSPYLTRIKNFQIYVLGGDEILNFGAVGDNL